jgi:hypothetical protein
MERMHPEDLRALVAAMFNSQQPHPSASTHHAIHLADDLLRELRTAKPEPGWHHGSESFQLPKYRFNCDGHRVETPEEMLDRVGAEATKEERHRIAAHIFASPALRLQRLDSECGWVTAVAATRILGLLEP